MTPALPVASSAVLSAASTASKPEFQKIVGTEWKPGINAPFDPVATKKAAELGLTVFMSSGSDLDNLDKILRGLDFFGTVIGVDR